MNLHPKFTIQLFGKKTRSHILMTEKTRSLLKEIGNGRITDGVNKLTTVAKMVQELSSNNTFDHGYFQLIRMIEIMQNEENDGNLYQTAKMAKSEMDEQLEEIRVAEAKLAVKKLNLGLAKLRSDVDEL
jgi:hypothetical protein